MSWKYRIKNALERINDVYRKFESQVERIQEHPVLDAAAKTAIKSIPIAGPIIEQWYNDIGYKNPASIKQIKQLLENYKELTDEQFDHILVQMNKDKESIVKSQDMMSLQIRTSEKMLAGEIRINREEIVQNRKIISQILEEMDRAAIQNVQISQSLLDEMNESRLVCKNRGIPYRVPNLLLVLLKRKQSIALKTLNSIEPNKGDRYLEKCENFVAVQKKLEEKENNSFDSFDWNEKDYIKLAKKEAYDDSMSHVNEKHLLLGLLKCKSNTIEDIKKDLGPNYQEFLDRIESHTTIIHDRGTPGNIIG